MVARSLYRPRFWQLDTWLVSWEHGGQCFAVRVRTDPEGTITEAAPLVRRFIGQKLQRLTAWVRYKRVRVDLLKELDDETERRSRGSRLGCPGCAGPGGS